MRLLRGLAIAVGAVVLLIGAVAVGARFADGPILMFPGGVFASGEWVGEPVDDWSFAADIAEIELQSGEPASSRTTWILVDEGRAYVPCSLGVPPGKHWHTDALGHPDAIVRIDGKLYPRRLEKVDDPTLEQRLAEIVKRKYGRGPAGSSGTWFFELAPPS